MPVCQDRHYDPGQKVSGNGKNDPILTLRSPVPDVQLEYASTGQFKIMPEEAAVVDPHQFWVADLTYVAT